MRSPSSAEGTEQVQEISRDAMSGMPNKREFRSSAYRNEGSSMDTINIESEAMGNEQSRTRQRTRVLTDMRQEQELPDKTEEVLLSLIQANRNNQGKQMGQNSGYGSEVGTERATMVQSQESSKDIWTSSQQSGLQAELTMAKGTAGNPQQIPLQLKWVKSYFSAEEKDFFAAAAMEGEISQTHYTNPEADMCYRCPICAKVINPSPLSKHTARHFLRMRNTPNCEYLVTLQEDPKKQIRIRTGGNMARRNGADPPPLSQIQDLEEQ